jgi:hypothetical protein
MTEKECIAFYDSLSENDKKIHNLAKSVLRTRYNPQHTNAWAVFWEQGAKKKEMDSKAMKPKENKKIEHK